MLQGDVHHRKQGLARYSRVCHSGIDVMPITQKHRITFRAHFRCWASIIWRGARDRTGAGAGVIGHAAGGQCCVNRPCVCRWARRSGKACGGDRTCEMRRWAGHRPATRLRRMRTLSSGRGSAPRVSVDRRCGFPDAGKPPLRQTPCGARFWLMKAARAGPPGIRGQGGLRKRLAPPPALVIMPSRPAPDRGSWRLPCGGSHRSGGQLRPRSQRFAGAGIVRR